MELVMMSGTAELKKDETPCVVFLLLPMCKSEQHSHRFTDFIVTSDAAVQLLFHINAC